MNILNHHYDDESDWGIKFVNGEILEARLTDASSDHLTSRVLPQLAGNETVIFQKMIFDQGEYFTFEALVLHPRSESVTVSTVGKIAGIDEIQVETRPNSKEVADSEDGIFSGRIGWVFQIMIPTAFGLSSVVGASLVTERLIPRIRSTRRRGRILGTRTIRRIERGEGKDVLVSLYVSIGLPGLKLLLELIADPDRLVWLSASEKWAVLYHHQIGEQATSAVVSNTQTRYMIEHELENLMTNGLLTRGAGNDAVIDPDFGKSVENLLAEL